VVENLLFIIVTLSLFDSVSLKVSIRIVYIWKTKIIGLIIGA